MVSIPAVFAQEKGEKKDDGWKDRIKAEKIAFITSELELTSEEAQAFWPIYNKYTEQCAEQNKAVREAYKDLKEAIEAESGVESKLDAYVKALDEQKCSAADAVKEYKKVLSAEKVAKLYVSEEKFRVQHIEKLHKGGDRGPQPRGPQPRDGQGAPQGAPQGQPNAPQQPQQQAQ